MQPITVAVADTNRDRRVQYECFLQSQLGIKLLANSTSNKEADNDPTFVDRRHKPRTDISASEDEVARIKRLKPLVLLVNLNLCTDEDYTLLLSLRCECPETLIVLLADDSIREDQLMKILEIGAKGCLKYESVQYHLSKAIQVVGCGEAWVSRKMLGKVMDHTLN